MSSGFPSVRTWKKQTQTARNNEEANKTLVSVSVYSTFCNVFAAFILFLVLFSTYMSALKELHLISLYMCIVPIKGILVFLFYVWRLISCQYNQLQTHMRITPECSVGGACSPL